MRFNVIERNPECYISSVRDHLENLLNAVIDRSENSFFQPMSEVKENENELKEMWETQQIRRIEK